MLTLIQVTDLHIDNNDPELELLNPKDNFKQFLNHAKNIPCDRIVVTGDVAEDADNFQTIKVKLQGLCGDITFVAGNHDHRDGYKMFNQKNPYFMEYLEEFIVLYLDSGKGIIDDEQLQWMKELLAINQKDILIFLHHPIIDCGNTIMDRMYPLRNRSDVYHLLQNTNKRIFAFSGHYHWEQEVQSGNITQYVTPSLLYQLDKNADILRMGSVDFGFRVINITNDKVETYVEMLI